MNDKTLWKTIELYDFDDPITEYGFSTRLQNENLWTTHFTETAILEYKKFMYLAASTGLMVSPSEIVDLVWHQHLVFTASYQQFCVILGKKIEHIPSTHNHNDLEKFRQAKERTSRAYLKIFGPQPEEIWTYPNMYAPLQLPKYQYRSSMMIYGALLSIAFLFVIYYTLIRLYPKINNPDFIVGYIILILTAGITLEIYNRNRFLTVLKSWPNDAFIFKLSPFELIYAKYGNLSHIVHGVISHLIDEQVILISPDQKLSLNKQKQHDAKNVSEFSVIATLDAMKPVNYDKLLSTLVLKPGFNAIARVIASLNKHFRKSRYFVYQYMFNLLILLSVLFPGLIRLSVGISREKPVLLLSFLMIAYLIFIIYYLTRIKKIFLLKVLPEFYKSNTASFSIDAGRWDWNYFLIGTGAITPALFPLVRIHQRKNNTDSGGCSTSGDGDSCGSSGCGGCGGGD